jgi:acyl-CoA synthetase (AMP-forming)/AMP-acid ligase II
MRKATSTFPDAPRTSSFRVAITSIPPSKRPLKPFRVPTVIGVQHVGFGEAIVAIVAPKAGAQIDEEKIQAAIAGHLAKYKQLKRVFVTSDATRWARIQKKDLRETYKGTFASR